MRSKNAKSHLRTICTSRSSYAEALAVHSRTDTHSLQPLFQGPYSSVSIQSSWTGENIFLSHPDYFYFSLLIGIARGVLPGYTRGQLLTDYPGRSGHAISNHALTNTLLWARSKALLDTASEKNGAIDATLRGFKNSRALMRIAFMPIFDAFSASLDLEWGFTHSQKSIGHSHSDSSRWYSDGCLTARTCPLK